MIRLVFVPKGGATLSQTIVTAWPDSVHATLSCSFLYSPYRPTCTIGLVAQPASCSTTIATAVMPNAIRGRNISSTVPDVAITKPYRQCHRRRGRRIDNKLEVQKRGIDVLFLAVTDPWESRSCSAELVPPVGQTVLKQFAQVLGAEHGRWSSRSIVLAP